MNILIASICSFVIGLTTGLVFHKTSIHGTYYAGYIVGSVIQVVYWGVLSALKRIKGTKPEKGPEYE